MQSNLKNMQSSKPLIKCTHNKKFYYRNKWYGYAMLAPGFILLTIFVMQLKADFQVISPAYL